MNQIYNTSANARLLQLLPNNVLTALDVGCGTGKLGAQLANFGIVTDGITYSESELQLANQNLRDVWLFDLEHGLPQIDRKYDAVILSHVMEHISDPSRLLSQLKSVLSPSGHILCAIPNMLFLYNRIKLMAGRIEYEERGLMDYTHVRWYTRKTLLEVFRVHGYCPDAALVHGYAPLGPLRKAVTDKMAQWLDKTIIRLSPDLLACEFAFRFKNCDYPAP